ncbi:hypothetical protein MGN70_010211 [Eutypa lata]|nr:hypothetical protein MGN70_010211 [Eutypa lata]
MPSPPPTEKQPPAPPAPAAEIKATYNTPYLNSAPLTFTAPLSHPIPSGSVPDKTAYLTSLRGAVVDLQERINAELTARMEEDKAREASAANDTGAARGDVIGSDVKAKKGSGKGGAVKKGNNKKEIAAAAAAAVVDENAEKKNYGEEVVDDED